MKLTASRDTVHSEHLRRTAAFDGLPQNTRALITALDEDKTSVSVLAAAIAKDGDATRRFIAIESQGIRQPGPPNGG